MVAPNLGEIMLYIVKANVRRIDSHLQVSKHTQEVFHPVNASSERKARELVRAFYDEGYEVDISRAGQFINEITESDTIEQDPDQLDLFNNKS